MDEERVPVRTAREVLEGSRDASVGRPGLPGVRQPGNLGGPLGPMGRNCEAGCHARRFRERLPAEDRRMARPQSHDGDLQGARRGPRPDPPNRPRPSTGSLKIRSEEHTSELQSQSNLVCRLLLDKKKTMQLDTPSGPLATSYWPQPC